jgi:hypothetical protein
MSSGLRSERLFVELCNRNFLRGFVFHSPRFLDPTEKEAGDVVLWVRLQVLIFEIISREAISGASTKQFVKRIGEKRDQLVYDHDAFRNPDLTITLINEQGEKVTFDKVDLSVFVFSGIVIVDCDENIEKMHFGTIQKSLSLPFPVAIMTQQDFLDLTEEVDTIPDLYYYLQDRFEFLKRISTSDTHLILDLNNRLERNLIAFYKIHRNNFPVDEWKSEDALDYYEIYKDTLRDKILARNAENVDSFVIDGILDFLRKNNTPDNPTLLHSWELATMTRRQRAGWLSTRIRDAIRRMLNKNPRRHFAFFNQVTGCWLLFFFQYAGESDSFRQETERLTRYKLFVEMKESNFQFSVFGYGFRKSSIETRAIFDEVVLIIEDAKNYDSEPDDEYKIARQYCNRLGPQKIKEFPE